MAIVVKDNLMDGKSTIVPAGTALSEIPEHLRSRFSPMELRAFEDTRYIFMGFAQSAKLVGFRKWLEILAEADACDLESHESEVMGNETLLRFHLANGMHPALGFSRRGARSPLPEILRAIYQTISVVEHHEYGVAGGLLPEPDNPESVKDLLAMLGARATGDEDPGLCFPFYHSLQGDMLCYTPDNQAVWFNHEGSSLVQAGRLEDRVEEYFDLLARGRELSFPGP